MAKLKYTEKSNYKLTLDRREAEVLAYLVQHVRLGAGDNYKAAALRLCEAFGESEYSFESTDLDEYMQLKATYTQDEGYTIELAERPTNAVKGDRRVHCGDCDCGR